MKYKLLEFSKIDYIGPNFYRYYKTRLFPEEYCSHNKKGYKCCYKKYKDHKYCRTHSNLRINIISEYVIRDVAWIIVQY